MNQFRPAMLATVLMVSILSVCYTLYGQQGLDQRDSDFYSIVTINAKRMGAPLNTTPDVLVNYAKSMCTDIPQLGATAVVEKNRQSSESLQGNEVSKQQVADMVFRNSVSTYCSQYTQLAFNALNAPASNQQTARSEAKSESSIYDRFHGIVNGIDMRLHPSYTENYVKERAKLFCGLMNNSDMQKLTTEIVYPPQRWTETPKDRSRLETGILIAGTETYCPQNESLVGQWRSTYER